MKFIRREVSSLDQAKTILGCKVLVNASGMGAGVLAADPDTYGTRGQTMLVDYPVDKTSPTGRMDREVVMRRGSEYTYVIPRMHSMGVIIGGISEEGSSSTEISLEVKKDILRRVNLISNGRFAGLNVERDVKKDIAGIRPDRKGGYRLSRSGNVVHAYGFAGAGYRYSGGVALAVVELVKEATQSVAKL